MNIESLKKLIKDGESISVEFKECKQKLNRDIYESICAFLNRSGGHLVLGIRE